MTIGGDPGELGQARAGAVTRSAHGARSNPWISHPDTPLTGDGRSLPPPTATERYEQMLSRLLKPLLSIKGDHRRPGNCAPTLVFRQPLWLNGLRFLNHINQAGSADDSPKPIVRDAMDERHARQGHVFIVQGRMCILKIKVQAMNEEVCVNEAYCWVYPQEGGAGALMTNKEHDYQEGYRN